VFGSRPFQFLSEIDVLVAQMIHFVEELAVEWTAEWERLKMNSKQNWDDHIPGTSLNFCIGLADVSNQDRMPVPSKLEERFKKKALDTSLMPLLPIMQGLMRFRPSNRISAVEALRLLDG
jgi:serine/threonine-protein kinase SRPK3